MIFDLKMNPVLFKLGGNFLKHVERFEMLELLRLDIEKGVKVLLGELILKEGSKISDIKLPKRSKFSVIKGDGRKYIVIITGRAPNQRVFKLFNKFQADVIWTTPTFWENDNMTMSVLGDEEELKKVLKTLKFIGKVSNIRYHKPVYNEHNLLSVLTDKQREIIITAKHSGYYDYPRKIDTAGLAVKVGVSKATVVEHLRKAEGRLMGNILAGY
jgi:predicted DNA binding protein